MQSETKNCQNCKKNFTIEKEDFNFYEKMKVPPPTFCPECRSQRRMTSRNERVLYKAVCDLCKKNIISMYDSKEKTKIYCDDCWWGDKWDPTFYGNDYNFFESFFEQWRKLLKEIPLIQAWKFNNVNSDYVNYATEDRNCFLSYSVVFCENVAYSYSIDKSQDTLDSMFVNKSNWCYEIIDSQNNYNSVFLKNCSNCIDSSFLFDCINCQNCFLSSNLRNKKYVFKNTQFLKTEYESKMKEIKTGDYKNIQKIILEFSNIQEKKSIHKYTQVVNGVKYSGNNIENSKNTINCFNVYNSENIKYSIRIGNSKDCVDTYGTIETELIYEAVAPAFRGSNVQFSFMNQTSHDLRYSSLCSASSNLFACIGLRNKSYCILNKQYTKEEYEELVPKIIKHMNDMPYIDKKGRIYKYGEFFPSELSPFCYNETIAQEYFPLTKEQAIEQGYKWKDKEERNYTIDIRTEDIPNDIKDVDETIINKVIECKHQGKCNKQCTEAFKIIPDEYQFYKRMNLPLPHLCPNCRHYQRLKQRNPLKLWHRKCMKKGCTNEFETSYAPDRPEIVYCESCYNKEIY